MKIGIIIGSTRPNRLGPQVGAWIFQLANIRNDAEFELIDLADIKLPFLDEPAPAAAGNYTKPHTQAWARTIAALDAFVFVTPEYNFSTSPALKNALDFLYAEWNNKPAAFVSYGAALGVRAVEHLRGVTAQLQMADIGPQVALSLFDDFQSGVFKPRPLHVDGARAMLDQLVGWSGALKAYRAELETQAQRRAS